MTGAARIFLQVGLLTLFIAGSAHAQNADRSGPRPAPVSRSAKKPPAPDDKKRREKLEREAAEMKETLEATPRHTWDTEDSLNAPASPLPEPTH